MDSTAIYKRLDGNGINLWFFLFFLNMSLLRLFFRNYANLGVLEHADLTNFSSICHNTETITDRTGLLWCFMLYMLSSITPFHLTDYFKFTLYGTFSFFFYGLQKVFSWIWSSPMYSFWYGHIKFQIYYHIILSN